MPTAVEAPGLRAIYEVIENREPENLGREVTQFIHFVMPTDQHFGQLVIGELLPAVHDFGTRVDLVGVGLPTPEPPSIW